MYKFFRIASMPPVLVKPINGNTKAQKGKWVNCTAPSASTTSLRLNAKASINGHYYRCKITDNVGNVVYSNSVKLNVK